MKTKELVFTALFMGIVFVMSMFKNLGFIDIGPFVSVTVIHIPVIIGAIYLGTRGGSFIGLAFGVASFINSMSSPAIFAPVFANPVVSVLPRIAFGMMIYPIYKLFSKLFKNKKSVAYAFTAATTTLLHTLIVVPLMFYFGMSNPDISGFVTQTFGNTVFSFVWGVLIANGLMEMLIAAIIVPLVMRSLDRLEN